MIWFNLVCYVTLLGKHLPTPKQEISLLSGVSSSLKLLLSDVYLPRDSSEYEQQSRIYVVSDPGVRGQSSQPGAGTVRRLREWRHGGVQQRKRYG